MLQSTQMNHAQINRRRFMQSLALFSGISLSNFRLKEVAGFNLESEEPLEIIIVGAGLAGLCAAYELEKLGHQCTILEADQRHIGGRARTLRFGDGLYGEAGPMRIPQNHDLTRHYVKMFGLELRPFVHSNSDAFYHLRNKHDRIKNVDQFGDLYTLTDGEQGLLPDDLWVNVIISLIENLSQEEKDDLYALSPQTETIRELDKISLYQALLDGGLSHEAIEFLSTTYALETLLPSALTEHLREEIEEVWIHDFDEIVGGMDRLPAAFAENLKSKPMLGRPVIRIEQNLEQKRVAAIYRENREEKRAEGDYLLCTVPFSVLERIDVSPALSGPKQRAIRQLHYDSAVKTFVVANQRFWESEENIYGGGTVTDLPIGSVYYPSDNASAQDSDISAGPGVMLASYTWGNNARRLSALSVRTRSQEVIRHLSQIHPQLNEPGIVRRSASWSWDQHPWSRGAYAFFAPGQHSALHEHIATPEGRIHFAGEHTSLTHSWMQGALESALRAVADILQNES
ncbi:MAG: FAD-dependent oxidoreductase [Chloroflexota bacterium]